MQDVSDMALLRHYVHRNSDEAFAALVSRHVNMVYSAALRKTSNPHAAEEITQAVFIILAKKAGELREKTVLSGWLYQAARLTAASFRRSEFRRARREHEAHMQYLAHETESELWPQMRPFLEDALGRLGEKDRNAIALRFFEGKSFQEIGVTLGGTENAAQKRVNYALEKLRRYLSKQGVTSTTLLLTRAISANCVQIAPVALANSVTAAALAKGAATGGSTLTLIKGALKIMAWTKAKTAIVVGAAVILAAGTATVTIRAISQNGDASQLTQEGWQLLQAGRRPEATAKFKQAVKNDPKSAEAWNGLGWVYFNSNQPKEAEQTFQKVLTLNPNHPAALNGLGQLYLAQRNYDEAETYLLKAAPNAPAAWYGLARLYLLQGKFDQAEEWARQVVDSGQGDAMAKMMLQAAQDKKMSASLRGILEPK